MVDTRSMIILFLILVMAPENSLTTPKETSSASDEEHISQDKLPSTTPAIHPSSDSAHISSSTLDMSASYTPALAYPPTSALVTKLESDQVSQTISDLVSLSVSDRFSPSISDTVYTSLSDQVSRTVSGQVSPTISDQVSPTISDQVSPSISDQVSPTISDQVSPTTSDQVSQIISDLVSPSVSETVSPTGSDLVSQTVSVFLSASDLISPSVSDLVSPSVSDLVSPSVPSLVSPSVSAILPSSAPVLVSLPTPVLASSSAPVLVSSSISPVVTPLVPTLASPSTQALEPSSTMTPVPPSTSAPGLPPTPPLGTTPVMTAYTASKAALSLKIELTVSIDTKFNDTLDKQESHYYKDLSTKFETELSKLYVNTSGFRYIRVTGFSNGSIHCHYEAVFAATVNLTVVAKETNNSHIKVNNLTVNTTSAVQELNQVAEGSLCNSLKDACRTGYVCEPSPDKQNIICTYSCNKEPHKCGDHGVCYYDTVLQSTKCRCSETDEAIYGGQNCNDKVEKLAMTSTGIISIAAGCGGAVVAILVTAIVCLVVRKKYRQSGVKHRGQDSELDKEAMMMDRFKSSHQTERNQNVYMGGDDLYHRDDQEPRNQDSRTSIYRGGNDRRSFDNRRDSNEGYTYIYQPTREEKYPGSTLYTDLLTSSQDNFSVQSSVYDKIDTTAKFEIRRPQIRTRHSFF